jgi:hypothetical protein
MFDDEVPLGAAHKREPLRQGDLDGLCGVYSAINAVRLLCPEIDRTTSEAIFAELVYGFAKAGVDPPEAVTVGVGKRVINTLIRKAVRYAADELDIQLTVRQLRKAVRKSGDLNVLWRTLHAALSPSCVAVLGLGGWHNHWTVAVSASEQQIRLFDSSTMRVLNRGRCTVDRRGSKRVVISPPHVFLITRRG